MAVVETSQRSDRRRTDISREIRLLRTWPKRIGFVAFIALALILPLEISDPFWSALLTLAAISAIAAIGLNFSMGYTGQLSLGHSAFLAVGAYTAAATGQAHGWPLIAWLPTTALVTGLLGAAVGLFTLRLRGPYLAIVSIGLVFLAIYVFSDWTGVSGGVNGRAFNLPMSLFGLNFANPVIGGTPYGRNQGYGVFAWLFVGFCLLICHNIVRSGFGRSMLAVREQDIAAEVLGVRPLRTKVIALGIGSAMAGVAGALMASELQFVLPTGWDLNLSIQFVAMIVLGGMGTLWGPVLGALFITAIPQLLSEYAGSIPFVKQPGAPGAGISSDSAGLIVYGALIVLVLLVFPEGIVGVGVRAKSVFQRADSRLGGNTERE